MPIRFAPNVKKYRVWRRGCQASAIELDAYDDQRAAVLWCAFTEAELPARVCVYPPSRIDFGVTAVFNVALQAGRVYAHRLHPSELGIFSHKGDS